MKQKTVTTNEFEFSDLQVMGILLKYLVNEHKLVISSEDTSRIELDNNKVIITATARQYKKL